MDYYCDVCDKYIKPKSKIKKIWDQIFTGNLTNKHILFSPKDIDINNVDEAIIFLHY